MPWYDTIFYLIDGYYDFYLRNGRPVVVLAFDDLTSSVRKPLNAYCQERLPEYEAAGLATLVDCYSSLAGSPSEEKYALKNRVDLNELSLLVTNLMNEKVPLGSPKVFLDSLTPLFNDREPQLVVQFVTSVGAKIKTKGAAFLFSVTSGTVSNEILTRLETTADFVDELRFTEVEGRQRGESRWTKARGISIPRNMKDSRGYSANCRSLTNDCYLCQYPRKRINCE